MRLDALQLQTPVQRAVLDGLEDVGGADVLRLVEVGEGAGDLENPVVGAGREVEVLHGLLEEGGGLVVELAVGLDEAGGHGGVGGGAGVLGEAGGLDVAGRHDALADAGGALSAGR